MVQDQHISIQVCKCGTSIMGFACEWFETLWEKEKMLVTTNFYKTLSNSRSLSQGPFPVVQSVV